CSSSNCFFCRSCALCCRPYSCLRRHTTAIITPCCRCYCCGQLEAPDSLWGGPTLPHVVCTRTSCNRHSIGGLRLDPASVAVCVQRAQGSGAPTGFSIQPGIPSESSRGLNFLSVGDNGLW
ncbi:hypothetical protein DUNSADRAFT_1355, partial [Dunaliella salina]